jgi:hypothetical protein
MKRPVRNSHPSVAKEWTDVEHHMVALCHYYQTAVEWFWQFQYTRRIATSEGRACIALPNALPMHNKYRPLQDNEERLEMPGECIDSVWQELEGRTIIALERDYSAATFFVWRPNMILPEHGSRGNIIIDGIVCIRMAVYIAIVLK